MTDQSVSIQFYCTATINKINANVSSHGIKLPRTTTSLWLRPVLFKVIMEGTHLFARSRPAMVHAGSNFFSTFNYVGTYKVWVALPGWMLQEIVNLENDQERTGLSIAILWVCYRSYCWPHTINVCIDSIDRWWNWISLSLLGVSTRFGWKAQ